MSGSKDKRPALDWLVIDAKRRRFDTLVGWRLDRPGRNLRHLILLLDELQSVSEPVSREQERKGRASVGNGLTALRRRFPKGSR